MTDREAARFLNRICWETRRARGMCMRCAGRSEINTWTGKPFWKCRPCRIAESRQRKLERDFTRLGFRARVTNPATALANEQE